MLKGGEPFLAARSGLAGVKLAAEPDFDLESSSPGAGRICGTHRTDSGAEQYVV